MKLLVLLFLLKLYARINILNIIIIVTNIFILEFLSAPFLHPGPLQLSFLSF